MKGLALWTYMVLLITVISVAFLTQAVLGAVGETVRNSARLQTDQITGIINFMHSAPEGTKHAFRMPQVDCRVEFNSIGVIVSVRSRTDETFTSEFVERSGMPVVVEDESSVFDCKLKPSITFLKCADRIKVSSRAVVC